VLVWRENKGWTGPYDIASIDGYNITVDMVNGPTQFRATHVKPYYSQEPTQASHDSESIVAQPQEQPQPRERGRPRKGEKRLIPAKKRPIRHPPRQFLTQKEKDNFALALKLRQDNIITAPGAPYEISDAEEIDALMNQEVFTFVRYDPTKFDGVRVYKTRMVREIKNKSTKPIEKSRLVVQGYGDDEKETILTQAPTIQRMSQRLILALGPTLVRYFGARGELRDITQAYTQSKDPLTRTIIARLPIELQPRYPPDTILRIKKPLYGLAESGLYWFKTYHAHHREALKMSISTYDPCLLFTTEEPDTFAITGLQTDDTFSFVTARFSEREEEGIQTAGYRAKPKTTLREDSPIDFNGGRIQLHDGNIEFTQKGQASQLRTIDLSADDAQQEYIAQRARGAYIASICQPEAAYDLSTAAQVTEPTTADMETLNARIQWQMDNPD
jgi:hypothetical protein